MSQFVAAVKADLLDRRLLPLVAVLALALVAAIAYVALGGSSSPSTPSASVASAPAVPAGVAVTQTTSEKAVAETTGGGASQQQGSARNPFAPLANSSGTSSSGATGTKGSQTSTSSTSSPSSGASPSSGSSSGSTGQPGGSSQSGGSSPTPSTPPKPTHQSSPKPAQPKTIYHVAVLFGALPAGSTAPAANLTPYENLKLLAPLPSAKQPLIVFRGVTSGGKSAAFTLVSEAILHGKAACLPSAEQCESIELGAGESEQLEYLSPSTGQLEAYELRVVSIAAKKGSGDAVSGLLRGESSAGRRA
ncbi:MAG TPA: hypothetical protein VKV16_05545, partial [Solirubrobacteraceae bacterium]|nr:hypothetical protein [Solirubrobacteraceae bacterium]